MTKKKKKTGLDILIEISKRSSELFSGKYKKQIFKDKKDKLEQESKRNQQKGWQ